MADTAIGTSAYLARDEKPYNKFKPEALNKNLYFIENTSEATKKAVKRFGLRNSQLLTIAPTGSISTMLGVSGGIEPIFDISYTRKTESLHDEDVYYKVFTPIVKEYLDNNEVIYDLITSEPILPEYFVTAKKIEPKKRIQMQSIWQKHIDASISSTVNLPASATVKDVEKLYISAWKNGLKGLTVFRENCARTGILTSDKPKDEKPKRDDGIDAVVAMKEVMSIPNEIINPKPVEATECERLIFNNIVPVTRRSLGKRLDGATYVKKTACGKLYITINRDENDNLVEVFIDPGKSGGCVANAESLGRMASTMLRGGISIESIIDSTKGVKCSACTQAKGSKKDIDGLSCGDIIARTIKEEYDRLHGKISCSGESDSCAKCENKCELGMEEVPNKETSRLENIAKMLNPENWVVPASTCPCPECGVEMINEGGCVTCKNCGYSKCD